MGYVWLLQNFWMIITNVPFMQLRNIWPRQHQDYDFIAYLGLNKYESNLVLKNAVSYRPSEHHKTRCEKLHTATTWVSGWHAHSFNSFSLPRRECPQITAAEYTLDSLIRPEDHLVGSPCGLYCNCSYIRESQILIYNHWFLLLLDSGVPMCKTYHPSDVFHVLLWSG